MWRQAAQEISSTGESTEEQVTRGGERIELLTHENIRFTGVTWDSPESHAPRMSPDLFTAESKLVGQIKTDII